MHGAPWWDCICFQLGILSLPTLHGHRAIEGQVGRGRRGGWRRPWWRSVGPLQGHLLGPWAHARPHGDGALGLRLGWWGCLCWWGEGGDSAQKPLQMLLLVAGARPKAHLTACRHHSHQPYRFQMHSLWQCIKSQKQVPGWGGPWSGQWDWPTLHTWPGQYASACKGEMLLGSFACCCQCLEKYSSLSLWQSASRACLSPNS